MASQYVFDELAAMGRQDTALAVLEDADHPLIGFMADKVLLPGSVNYIMRSRKKTT